MTTQYPKHARQKAREGDDTAILVEQHTWILDADIRPFLIDCLTEYIFAVADIYKVVPFPLFTS